ncbi:hypothetical protein A4G20_10410 [Pasteurellaceae bacterium RH1A]|nr:hypothetical protein A4G20_10410 [Pasteurellaceae bacterium RH1A]
MKKSFFLLPLAALALNACISSTPAGETESTVATSSAYDLQTEVQSVEMPSTMTSYPQPTYTPPPAPTYSQPAPTAYQPTAVSSGDFAIPRDSAGKPIYSQMTKGAYTGSSYTVQRGDTMYLVGFISGKGADEVARLNGLATTAPLKVGQVLRLQ